MFVEYGKAVREVVFGSIVVIARLNLFDAGVVQ